MIAFRPPRSGMGTMPTRLTESAAEHRGPPGIGVGGTIGAPPSF